MGCRVVVADQARFMRRMLVQMLTQEGYDVVAEAADGQTLVELYQRHRPDVVILDIYLPELDGITATAALRAVDPRAKVIVCTAVAERAALKRAVAAGAVDFLVKPVARERVVAAVEAAMGRGTGAPSRGRGRRARPEGGRV